MSGLMEFVWRWETLWWLMVVLYVPSCIGLIIVVLLQKGKGVGFGGAFGMAGGGDTVFGPRSGQSLASKLTLVMAVVFMTLAIAMSLVAGKRGKGDAPEREEVAMSVFSDTDIGTKIDGEEDVEGDAGDGVSVEPEVDTDDGDESHSEADSEESGEETHTSDEG